MLIDVCTEMELGQLVHSENFSLMESMSAVEVSEGCHISTSWNSEYLMSSYDFELINGHRHPYLYSLEKDSEYKTA